MFYVPEGTLTVQLGDETALAQGTPSATEIGANASRYDFRAV